MACFYVNSQLNFQKRTKKLPIDKALLLFQIGLNFISFLTLSFILLDIFSISLYSYIIIPSPWNQICYLKIALWPQKVM